MKTTAIRIQKHNSKQIYLSIDRTDSTTLQATRRPARHFCATLTNGATCAFTYVAHKN